MIAVKKKSPFFSLPFSLFFFFFELRKAVAPLESKKTLENSGGKLPKFTCPAQLVNLLRNRYRTLSAVQNVNKKQYVTTESIPKY